MTVARKRLGALVAARSPSCRRAGRPAAPALPAGGGGAALLGQAVPEPIADAALPHRVAVTHFAAGLIGGARAAGLELHWTGDVGNGPDGRLALAGHGVELVAVLELDRGTETWSWLTDKMARLTSEGGPAVLVCCTGAGRAREAVKRLRPSERTTVVVTTLADHLADPLGPVWTPAGGGIRLALAEIGGR